MSPQQADRRAARWKRLSASTELKNSWTKLIVRMELAKKKLMK